MAGRRKRRYRLVVANSGYFGHKGRHIGATGIVKSQSGGDESVEADEADAAEAAAVDAMRFRHIGLEVIIRRLVAEVEAALGIRQLRDQAWIITSDVAPKVSEPGCKDCGHQTAIGVGAFRSPFLVLKLLADFVPADPFPIVPNTILHGAILSSEVPVVARAS